jgi:shikimate kinase
MQTTTCRIALAGAMGSGKSTIGQACAIALGWNFVDTDALIVEHTGMSILDIFEKHGETHFRDIETAICRQALSSQASVVGLGGGSLGSQGVRDAVFAPGSLSVWLQISDREAERRLGADTGRPLWKDGGIERWRALTRSRQVHYEQCVLHIEADGRSVDSICREICDAALR